jgi:hypothetical protein
MHEVNGAVEFRMPGYLYNVTAPITEVRETGVVVKSGDALVFVASQDIRRYYTPTEWHKQHFDNGNVKPQ